VDPRKWHALFVALTAPLAAVEVRVATFNVGAQFTENSQGIFYPEFGLGAAGTPDHESVKAVLARIDADVVALQEIDSADSAGSPNDVQLLAAALGYPHVYIAPNGGSGGLVAPFDSDLRVAVLSRHPFLSTTAVRSPAGARELTRLHAAVKVDVPGTTQDPWVLTGHMKPGGSEDRFRRAVEMKRLADHLAVLGLTEQDNYILTGDFNLSPLYGSTTYSSLPSGLPGTYDLGEDYPLPIRYSTDPLDYFSTPGVVRLDPRQLNGSAVTFSGGAGYTLDLMLVSPALAARQVDAEVYNSALDGPSAGGLPKAGSPPASGTSLAASDHYAVFADLELDDELPDLQLALSAATVREGLPDGPLTATVTLPALRPATVSVVLSSDDPGVIPAGPVVIPAGSLTGSTSVAVPRDFIAGPTRSAGLGASATGYDPAAAVLQVLDADQPYAFTAVGQGIGENFDGFGGVGDPAPWSTTGGLAWTGMDDGSSTTPGLRAYGTAAERALGVLSSGTAATAVTTFRNDSPQVLTALEVAVDIEQWRAATAGAQDRVEVEIFHAGQVHPLPGLSHVASTSLPAGPVPGGFTTARSAVLGGLAVPPGESFELRLRFLPDSAGAPLPADVFVNEFHYDNVGEDVDEFVEVVVGPGFDGTTDDIELVPYNGVTAAAAVPYAITGFGQAIRLSAFTPGATVAGFRFYLLEAPANGIQNGGNDGFALIDRRSGAVLQLLSYEGTFTAAAGTPAAGLSSVSVGVSQNSSPIGASLRLSGAGAGPGDFTWGGSTRTPGQPNDGQTFTLPGLPPQGLAVDQVRVTFLADPDTDGDGLADLVDPDDDNDGQTDADEIAFGTDPLDRADFFAPVISRAGGLQLAFPAADGIVYTVEGSSDLLDWETVSIHTGAGSLVAVPLPAGETAMFFRVRAGP
jgi:endonuclease/exonuclease/phosphatase family metal-dependent hydrolase